MNYVEIDLETRSDIDLKKVGVYKYADSDQFDIQLMTILSSSGNMITFDLTGSGSPESDYDEDYFHHWLMHIVNLKDGHLNKAANAAFERVCLSVYIRRNCPWIVALANGPDSRAAKYFESTGYLCPDNWWCDLVHAAMYGLPPSLDGVAKALELSEQKDSRGKALINFFAKPTKDGTFRYPGGYPDKWATYIEYNKQDVVTEHAIGEYLAKHYTKDLANEMRNYRINEEVNDRGVYIDTDICESVVEYNSVLNDTLIERSRELTGLENPNSLTQLKGWLAERGVEVSKLTKDVIPEVIDGTDDLDVIEVMEARKALGKASVKKFQAMLDAMCSDGCVHGVMKFYGANRSGRFSGRLIQTQNFTKPHMPAAELDDVLKMIRSHDWEMIESCYDPTDIMSQVTRPAMRPRDGYLYSIADYSAIEARVIAWIAHQTEVEEVFRTTGKIYERTAAMMFKVDESTIVKGNPNYDLRQRGKVAVLACGYGGGASAMAAMDYAHAIDPDDYPMLVKLWRNANPKIVALWGIFERMARSAIQEHRTVTYEAFKFKYKNGCLFIQLPSGRWLTYFKCCINPETDQIEYLGKTSRGAWTRVSTWGGKITENIVQAISRDVLCDAIQRIKDRGIDVVFHVHDEIICEVPEDRAEEFLKIHEDCMTQNSDWDTGLYHPAPGYTTPYYTKD